MTTEPQYTIVLVSIFLFSAYLYTVDVYVPFKKSNNTFRLLHYLTH
jgi:hypothetical protein